MYVVDEKGDNVHDCTKHKDHYWRRNMFGGSRQAELLVTVGIGAWGPNDAWEAAEKEGWPTKPESATYDEDTDKYVGEGVEEWYAAMHARLRDPRGVSHGIPVYKLCNSNDGWWVTKEECEHALILWEAAGQPDVDDFGQGPYGDTIPFLRAAADHHGFRVF